MCAAYETRKGRRRPGKPAGVWRGKDQPEQLVWAGFAGQESLSFWKKERGGLLVDVPADRFAERSDRTRELRWADVPAGHVIRGLLDPNEGQPLLKIVTRASTSDELEHFEHPRMPLIEPPLFSSDPVAILEENEAPSAQGELF